MCLFTVFTVTEIPHFVPLDNIILPKYQFYSSIITTSPTRMPLVPTIWNRGAAASWKIGMSSSWSELTHPQNSLFRFHFITMDWSETVWARTPSELRVAAPLNFWRSVSRSYVRQSIVGPYSRVSNRSGVSNSEWRLTNFLIYYIKMQDFSDFWPILAPK